jgi:hypothetical protein
MCFVPAGVIGLPKMFLLRQSGGTKETAKALFAGDSGRVER